MRKALKDCIHVAGVAMVFYACGCRRSSRGPRWVTTARYSLAVYHNWSWFNLTYSRTYMRYISTKIQLWTYSTVLHKQAQEILHTTDTFTVLMCCAILFKNRFHDGLRNNFLSTTPSSFCESPMIELALLGLLSLSLLLLLLELGFIVPNGLRGSVKVRFRRDPSTCFGVMLVSVTSLISSLSEHDFKTDDKLLLDMAKQNCFLVNFT